MCEKSIDQEEILISFLLKNFLGKAVYEEYCHKLGTFIDENKIKEDIKELSKEQFVEFIVDSFIPKVFESSIPFLGILIKHVSEYIKRNY